MAIDAGIKETIIVYTLDHNGDHLYLGIEDKKPFRIFDNLDLKQIHETIAVMPSYQQTCTFELLSGIQDVPCTSMNLGLSWFKFELLQKPGVDAKAVLYVNFVNGEEDVDTHEATQHLWNSIHHLERYDYASRNNGDFSSEIVQTYKSERVLAFLKAYSDNELLDADVQKRQDYDFTDYFWEFVQGIYQDLLL